MSNGNRSAGTVQDADPAETDRPPVRVAPEDSPMSPVMRVLLVFVAVNAFAAATSLLLFPADTDAGFFWEFSPPISAAMFGALYLLSGLLVARAAVQGRWVSARYLVPMVLVFSTFMLLTTGLHVDRFDGGVRLAYWLAVYVVALVATAAFAVLHERRVRSGVAPPSGSARTSLAVRRASLLIGVVVVVFAVVGYVLPELVAAWWPWELSPLIARAFLSWLAAFGVGLVWVFLDADRRRTLPVGWLLVVTAPVLTALLIGYRADVTGGPLAVALFIAGLVGMALLGVAMIMVGRRDRSSIRP